MSLRKGSRRREVDNVIVLQKSVNIAIALLLRRVALKKWESCSTLSFFHRTRAHAARCNHFMASRRRQRRSTNEHITPRTIPKR